MTHCAMCEKEILPTLDGVDYVICDDCASRAHRDFDEGDLILTDLDDVESGDSDDL